MAVKEINNDSLWRFNRKSFRKGVESYCSNGFKQFKKMIYSHLFFHLFFLSLLATEILSLFFFLTFFFLSSWIAFSLAALLLTGFSYLVLIFYFQAKKSEQFLELRNWFMLVAKKNLPSNIDRLEYHLSLANAAYSFASYLSQKEKTLYSFSQMHGSLNHLIQKLTHFYHRKDLHKMRELLILVSIKEHIEMVKKSPTNVEVHASLANAYIALSHLYQKEEGSHGSKEFTQKFQTAATKAIQEFEIINHYSPNDPWVYAQIASCYHDLKWHAKEITAYETILKLCPNDKDIMFRLGVLYFQQGANAQGLQIYEKLKALHFSRSEELIHFYDAHIKQEAGVFSF